MFDVLLESLSIALESGAVIAILIAIVVIVLILCGVILSAKLKRGKEVAYILNIIRTAQSQSELFNVEIAKVEEQGKGFSGILQVANKNELVVNVLQDVSRSFVGLPVHVYFNLREDRGQQLFVFDSRIRAVKSKGSTSSVSVAVPDYLQVGQKRHFNRVNLRSDEVNALGFWVLNEQQPMPKSTAELNKPLRASKKELEDLPIVMLDISATGMALQLNPASGPGLEQVFVAKGSQVLTLISFVLSDEQNATFWCTGEVVNVRPNKDDSGNMIYGVEFINWALLTKDQPHFNWHHVSPIRGVPIMEQWVVALQNRAESFVKE